MSGDRLYEESQRGFLFLRLDTQVREDGVYVKLWPLRRSFRRISADTIESVTETNYSPAEFGGWGWGIRLSPTLDSTAYRVRGDGGIRLGRTDDPDLFLGSQSPSRLAEAVRRAVGAH